MARKITLNAADWKTKQVWDAVRADDHAALVGALDAGGSAKGFEHKDMPNPLNFAKSAPVAETLIAHGANVNRQGGGNPPGSVWGKAKSGDAPLHQANLEVSKVLIAHGAKIDLFNNAGCTPLHLATFRNEPEKMEVLLQAGANPHIQERPVMAGLNRGTALHFAKSEAGITALLNHGADIEARNSKDFTPLHSAVCSNSAHVVKALIDAGADVQARENQRSGMTPLHLAAGSGLTEVGLALLAAGADPMLRIDNGAVPGQFNEDGATCIDYAEAASDGKLVQAMKRVVAEREANQLDTMTVQAAGAWSPSSADAEALMPASAPQAEHEAPAQQRARRL